MALAVANTVGTDRASRIRRSMEGLFIRSEHSGLVPMRFSQSQEILWQRIAPKLNRHEKLWFIVLKGRQVYASTFFQALTFVRTLEHPGTHSLVLAQDLFTAHELFDKSKTFHDHLPLPKMQPARINEIVFPFSGGTSKYRVISAGSVAKARGTTQTCVHASEVAFWPHAEIMVGLMQAMPDLPDTIWVLESTANGLAGDGKMFYEEWNRAVRGESDLEPVFIPWFAMPKYRRQPAIPPDDWDDEEKLLVQAHRLDGEQLAWRRYAKKTKCQDSWDKFHQEYPTSADEAFVSSGLPAFDRMAVTRQRLSLRDPVWRGSFEEGDGKLHRHDRGEVRIWAHPSTDDEYVIGADTAEGLSGGDYACAEVLNCRTLEQVASVHGTIQPFEFSVLLNHLGRYYNNAVLCIEVYPQGHRVQDHLIRTFYYPRLHQWRGKPDRVRLSPAKLYGWETNIWSRPLLIGAGQRAINHGLVTLHEEGLLEELLHFSKNDNGKYEAEVGHDDRVMALLLALRSREENYVERHVAPVISEESTALPVGIRVADTGAYSTQMSPEGSTLSSRADTARRLSKILRERAAVAAKNWMEF